MDRDTIRDEHERATRKGARRAIAAPKGEYHRGERPTLRPASEGHIIIRRRDARVTFTDADGRVRVLR